MDKQRKSLEENDEGIFSSIPGSINALLRNAYWYSNDLNKAAVYKMN